MLEMRSGNSASVMTGSVWMTMTPSPSLDPDRRGRRSSWSQMKKRDAR